jgi:hypothetical protein
MLAVFTVTNLNDGPVGMPGTLRQAVFDANNLPGADVIRFDAALSGAVDLSVVNDTVFGPTALLVTTPITIQGNGAGITIRRDAAAPEMRLFRVAGEVSLRLESISLSGGRARGPDDGEGRGGAIYNEGSLEIVATTLYDNQAIGGDGVAGPYGQRGLGGAIFNDAGGVLLENATLSGSVAQSGSGSIQLSSLGGGIYSHNGSVSIFNSTVTSSTASTGRGVYVIGSGAGNMATVEVYSSIIAQADSSSFARDFIAADDAGGGISVSGGNNLIRSQTGFDYTEEWDVDPLLGPLMNNGGPTPTHALSAQSPPVNEGANPRSLATDQRGPSYARVVGGQTDIGAFELQTIIGPALPGDYNENDVVDAADYVLWRKTLGEVVAQFSGADGSGNGLIDVPDYDVWHDQFGADSLPAASVFGLVAASADDHRIAPGLAAAPPCSVPARRPSSDAPPFSAFMPQRTELALALVDLLAEAREGNSPSDSMGWGQGHRLVEDAHSDSADVFDRLWLNWPTGRSLG